MSAIKFKHTGSFSKTLKFLNHARKRDYLNILDRYGQMGVEILSQHTPVDTGLTANSWTYEITSDKTTCKVSWYNTNNVINKTGYGFNVVMLLLYGHATRDGGWIEPNDFVTPAMKPLLDKLAQEAWEATLEE